jgi:hypothetical protein
MIATADMESIQNEAYPVNEAMAVRQLTPRERLGYYLRPHQYSGVHTKPKWRNWQTHGTQNPAVLGTMGVRPPPSAP